MSFLFSGVGDVSVPVPGGRHHLHGEHMWPVGASGGCGEPGFPGSPAGGAALPH